MARGTLRIVRPGLLTTVQDLGRWGHQSIGVPVAGVMDPVAHRVANALVGNPRADATLEISFAGPELEFEDDRVVALAGGAFVVTLNGTAVPHGEAFVVAAGSRVQVGERVNGARACLAVSGGFDTPPVLGSRSTHTGSGLGGLDGRALKAGDRVPLGDSLIHQPPMHRRRPVDTEVSRAVERVIRVLPGPHLDRFADGALDQLQSASYEVARDSNRMGYRLLGAPLPHARGADVISEATTWGALQVPATGQPILLMADRQTTGGYPIIATMITADASVAAQAAPGDRLRFEVCSRATALAALIGREQDLLVLESGVADLRPVPRLPGDDLPRRGGQ